MKKRLLSILLACVIPLCASLPAAAAEDAKKAPDVAITFSKPTYGDDVIRVNFDLTNYTKQPITLEAKFRLEVKKDGIWNGLSTADGAAQAELDAAGVQFPTKPGESTRLGAYIGGFRVKNGKETDKFEPGSYRIVLKNTSGASYYAPFQVVKGRLFSDKNYVMKTERPAYDPNIDIIGMTITNKTDESSSYGTPFGLEYKNGENWEIVPFKDLSDKAFPSIAILLFPQQTNEEGVSLSWFEAPFKPGRYRITKSIGEDDLCAEFSIVSPTRQPKLTEPETASITLKNTAGDGAFTVGPKESPDYVTELWHELLAFQRGGEQKGLTLSAKINLKPKTGRGTDVQLYKPDSEGRTWAEIGGNWYYVSDSKVLDRLESKGRELGAFLPATGEALVQALNKLEPLKKVQFSTHQFSSPFTCPGWQSDYDASGVTLSIFQFPSAAEVNRQMNYLYEDGYAVGIETRTQDAVSFGQQRFDWDEPPHYFKAGSRLVLYNGSNQEVLKALTGYLGEQVKTVEESTAETDKLMEAMENGL